ncbi:26.5 kDa heat shock protein, mitochondrial-like [Chenopodium quinoa]|uniref:SHSP domain-containing protein n=1 Tax=Chenopodium quinoa TaxID=63459 RepID=A0A803LN17_CHEQI|nr:26.5 kDa heat shock protein, mitochondrial-like [Chenopodium quinoa]
MAVARLALKNLQQKTASNILNNNTNLIGERLGGVQVHGWKYGLLQRLSTSAGSEGKEVTVQSDEGGRSRNIGSRWKSLLPRPFRKPASLWRRRDRARDTHPLENFTNPSLGNALLEAAENMNRLFENVIPTHMMMTPPTQFMGKFKETDESYKLRYDMPGLSKDDLKVTVDDGVLKIRGERKVEEEDESDDEYFMSYGYYNTSLVLPDDAKQDDIKAELKDGVLTITIPKTESHGKDVKEIEVN